MPEAEIVVVPCLAAFAAGWVDAVVGGSGMIQLPALLLPGATPGRIVNLATSVGALAVFVPQGAPIHGLGFAMAACNVVGGRPGATTAISRGSGFVRTVFLVVVARLAYDVVRGR